MKQHNMKPINKIILCIIVSLIIDFLFLYAEFWYFIYWGSSNTFLGLFLIPNEMVGVILFIITIIIAEIVVALTCKVLKLTPKGKKLFFIVNSILFIGYLIFWLLWWYVVW